MQKLKIICLNVWLGGKKWEAMVEFLLAEKPDILALQEAYRSSDDTLEPRFQTVQRLSQILGLPYTAFAPTFTQNDSKLEQGNAVLSAYPIRSQNVTFFDVPFGVLQDNESDATRVPRNLQQVTIDVHGQDLHVFNTQGIWGFDGKDNPRRLAMCQKTAEIIQDISPTILCGDFNVDERTASIATLEKTLHNVFKNTRQTSFNLREKKTGGFAQAIVDFLFISPDIRILDQYSPDVDISDHLPLVATLKLPDHKTHS